MPIKHDPRKNRSPIFWALVELHNSADLWFEIEPANKVKGCRGTILESLMRATIAFGEAHAGRHTPRQLARVRAALATCEERFKLLEHVVPEIFVEAQLRIDRIVAGIDAIASLPPAEWHQQPLPPLPGRSPEPQVGTTIQILSVISESVKRERQMVEERIQQRRRYRC